MLPFTKSGSLHKILIIDDDVSVRESIRDLLNAEEFCCSLASTGMEGLAIAHRENPELVVSDVQLPDISGYQICQTLKRQPSSRKIPVVMITGRFTEPQDKVQGLESGADEFLTKPFDPQYFIARVKSILRGTTQPA